MLPFEAALGSAMENAAPRVREHFLQASGTQFYRGVMRRIWRREGWRGRLAAPFLWIGLLANTLFHETGRDIPFTLENTVTNLPDGRISMTWIRRFYFRNCCRGFDAVMIFDRARGVIVDQIGLTRHLEVELHPRVHDGAMILESGRQWFRIWRWRMPVPRWFAGTAHVREYQISDTELGISVTISNPLLGNFFGYEGVFGPARRE
jgi:hypothetical protein